MKLPPISKIFLALFAFVFTTARAEDTKPIRALMVTGGCCHDYENQKRILSEGISKRANVVWTIVHEGNEPTDNEKRAHRVSIYEKDGWADGYDVVLHNECFGFVDDKAFVERVAKPHLDGLPAVLLHCSTHSYRKATTTDAWREVVGQTSFSHETRRALTIKNLKPDHPVMRGFPAEWKDPAPDELYKNEKRWPNFIALGEAFGVDTQKNHACIWVNTAGKGKVFGTTLGHDNKTMGDDVYLGLVTRGLLWATGHLNDDGTPAKGYGPGGK